MICTFGDITDVTWWRSSGSRRASSSAATAGSRVAMGRAGWESRDVEAARAAHAELAGLPAKRARTRIAELLGEVGSLVGEPKPVRHVVKFYEKGERPLEIVSSRSGS